MGWGERSEKRLKGSEKGKLMIPVPAVEQILRERLDLDTAGIQGKYSYEKSIPAVEKTCFRELILVSISI